MLQAEQDHVGVQVGVGGGVGGKTEQLWLSAGLLEVVPQFLVSVQVRVWVLLLLQALQAVQDQVGSQLGI